MCGKRFRKTLGRKPSPAATSRTDSFVASRATISISRLLVEMPPNHRLNQRKSFNEAATSDGVPESVSSSSRVGRRCIRRIVAEREKLVVRRLTLFHHGDTEARRKTESGNRDEITKLDDQQRKRRGQGYELFRRHAVVRCDHLPVPIFSQPDIRKPIVIFVRLPIRYSAEGLHGAF